MMRSTHVACTGDWKATRRQRGERGQKQEREGNSGCQLEPREAAEGVPTSYEPAITCRPRPFPSCESERKRTEGAGVSLRSFAFSALELRREKRTLAPSMIPAVVHRRPRGSQH